MTHRIILAALIAALPTLAMAADQTSLFPTAQQRGVVTEIEEQRNAALSALAQARGTIAMLQEQMAAIQVKLDEATKKPDTVKDGSAPSQK